MPSMKHKAAQAVVRMWGEGWGFDVKTEDQAFQFKALNPCRPDVVLRQKGMGDGVHHKVIYAECQEEISDDYMAKVKAQYGNQCCVVIPIKKLDLHMPTRDFIMAIYDYMEMGSTIAIKERRTSKDRPKKNQYCYRCKAEIPDGESVGKHYKRVHAKKVSE